MHKHNVHSHGVIPEKLFEDNGAIGIQINGDVFHSENYKAKHKSNPKVPRVIPTPTELKEVFSTSEVH